LRDRDEYRQEKTFNFENWQNQWFLPFIEGTIPAPLLTWQEIAVPEKRSPHKATFKHDIEPDWPDVNMGFLLEIYGWLPSLDEASSDEERAHWISIGIEFLSAMMRRFEIPLEDGQDFGGVPARTDLAAFRFIAKILLDLGEDENPKQLWLPILKLGPKARYWLQLFLTQFFIVALSSENISPRFVTCWKNMLEFALSDKEWIPGNLWLADESWEHLFGFDGITVSAWTEDRANLVEQIKIYYWRWLEKLAHEPAHRPSGIRPFLRFLRCQAANKVVCEALIRLEHYFAQASEHFWEDQYGRQALTRFVGFMWANYYEQIRSSIDMLRVFRFLVAKLAAHREPLALEIIASIGDGSR
jgi:hypothetical protein